MSKIELNVLAKDLDNAVAVTQAAAGNVYVGVLTKNFATVDEAVAQVKAYTAAGVRVSVGLGAGDPAMWRRVVDVSVATLPAHVNQVFPAAGLTVGSLEVAGATDTWVNALISPDPSPAWCAWARARTVPPSTVRSRPNRLPRWWPRWASPA